VSRPRETALKKSEVWLDRRASLDAVAKSKTQFKILGPLSNSNKYYGIWRFLVTNLGESSLHAGGKSSSFLSDVLKIYWFNKPNCFILQKTVIVKEIQGFPPPTPRKWNISLKNVHASLGPMGSKTKHVQFIMQIFPCQEQSRLYIPHPPLFLFDLQVRLGLLQNFPALVIS